MIRGTKTSRLTRRLAPRVGGVIRDRSGTTMVYMALVLPILLGAAGLAVDLGAWFAAKRLAQSAADAAAIAGAYEVVREGDATQVRLAAEHDATLNGYDPAAGDVLTINNPPASGPQAGATGAIETILRRTPPTFLNQLILGDKPVTVVARAVAMAGPADACVWALEPDDTALEVTGTANVQLGCGVFANSIDAKAIDQNGSSCLTASSIMVAGGYDGDCLDPQPRTGVPQLGDPLTYLQAPSDAGCDHPNKVKVTGGAVTLAPGTYCGGIEITGGEVELSPGTYVLKGGTLKVTGGATVSGDGVTFYLTEGTGGYADLSLESAAIDLSAPTSGPYKGVLFFQDRNAPESTRNKIAGNTELELDGILYFPTTQLDFAGGSAANPAATMIVARKVNFVGNSQIDAGTLTTIPIAFIPVSLVE